MKRTGKSACFTICSNNYTSAAKVFATSFAQFHPGTDLFLCLADKPDAAVEYPAEAEIIAAADLGIPDFDGLAFRYNVLEFNTAVKPFMFLWLLSRGYDSVLYFDPDIEVHAPLVDIFEALDGGASFVLTPHLCSPAPDWFPRTDIDILQTGIFNLGFAACSRTPETEPILRWWARRLRYECVVDTPRGIFVDQKFMDLIPGFASRAHILRETAYNVAYWNIAQRRLEEHDGRWTVDGKPLRFFHFSGFDPREPDRLSKYGKSDGREPPAALSKLLHAYAARLREAGYGNTREHPYGYGRFQTGVAIPDLVRRIFRERHPFWWGNPFENFDRFLCLPDPDSSRGASNYPVTNLMRYVHESRGDLRERFDLRSPDGADAYQSWWAEHAGDLRLEGTAGCV